MNHIILQGVSQDCRTEIGPGFPEMKKSLNPATRLQKYNPICVYSTLQAFFLTHRWGLDAGLSYTLKLRYVQPIFGI